MLPSAEIRSENHGSQRFINGEVHRWYRTVHGFADHLVSDLLDRLSVVPGQTVLDPFCGSGTTLVECMKRGIASVGVDANPASCFISQSKTTWKAKPEHLRELGDRIADTYRRCLRRQNGLSSDPTYQYLRNTGMLERNWINHSPLRRSIALKQSILGLRTSPNYRRLLMLALLTEFVYGASNIRFGPELYCGPRKTRVNLLHGFLKRLNVIASDLELVNGKAAPTTTIMRGDSRRINKLFSHDSKPFVDAVITSPPYPAEHDYTRNSRLELALLEERLDRLLLQGIKRTMLRSHTKGIYSTDSDALLVESNERIRRICRLVDKRSAEKSHGFARLYSTVIGEYFGGMLRHLQSLKEILKSGAMCAYVVGDQSCYLRVHIPTADILAELATDTGYSVVDVWDWRLRWSTITSSSVKERILIIKKV